MSSYTNLKHFHEKPLDSSSKVAYISSLVKVVNANQRHKNNFSLLICEEELGMINIVMYFPKSFYLTSKINYQIGQFSASGITQHIIDKYVDLRYYRVREMKKEPRAFTFNQLRGAFHLWMICCSICIFAFLAELSFKALYNRKGNSGNQQDIYVNILINHSDV